MKKNWLLAGVATTALVSSMIVGCGATDDASVDSTGSENAGNTELNTDLFNVSGEDSGITNVTQIENIDAYITVGDYTNLNISLSESYKPDQDMIEEYASYYYPQYATAVSSEAFVTDRAVEDGDIVNIDYTGYKDGEAFERGSTDGDGTALWIGSDTYIDGFEEGLVGVMPGETVSLDLTFPDNYGNTDLAGAAVVFEVTVNGIIEEKDILEAWNENSGDDAESYDDLLAYFEEYLTEQMQSDYEADLEAAIADELIAITEYNTEFPGSLILAYQNNASAVLEYYASMYGTDADTFALYMIGTSAEEYVVNTSYMQLKLAATCYAIAQKEGFMLDEETLKERTIAFLEEMGTENAEEQLDSIDIEEYRIQFIEEDVMAFIKETATVTTAD